MDSILSFVSRNLQEFILINSCTKQPGVENTLLTQEKEEKNNVALFNSGRMIKSEKNQLN